MSTFRLGQFFLLPVLAKNLVLSFDVSTKLPILGPISFWQQLWIISLTLYRLHLPKLLWRLKNMPLEHLWSSDAPHSSLFLWPLCERESFSFCTGAGPGFKSLRKVVFLGCLKNCWNPIQISKWILKGGFFNLVPTETGKAERKTLVKR